MAKGIYEISRALADFEKKYLNETNIDNLGNFWVVEYPEDGSTVEEICYETNIDTLYKKMGKYFNVDDLYMITTDPAEALKFAYDLLDDDEPTGDPLEEDINMGIDDNYQSNLSNMNSTFSPIDKIFDDMGGDRVYDYDDWYNKCNMLSVYGDELHYIPIKSGNAEICINTFNNDVLGVYSDENGVNEGIIFDDGMDIKVNTVKKYLMESKTLRTLE